jgi:hypothetical protein
MRRHPGDFEAGFGRIDGKLGGITQMPLSAGDKLGRCEILALIRCVREMNRGQNGYSG